MTQLIESKSLLAKLMATENLHIEQKNVRTASFDVKNRILTVPTLNNDIDSHTYDLFMGHEVGHALYTPLKEMEDAYKDGENMSVINVVEDSRIERKIKNKYPGLRHSFIRAYRKLFVDDFFGTEGKDLDGYNLIDRINLFCKVGAHLNISFNDEERGLLNDVESTQTYTEVVEVARRILQYMKDNHQNETSTKFDFNDFIDEEDESFANKGEDDDGEGNSSDEEGDYIITGRNDYDNEGDGEGTDEDSQSKDSQSKGNASNYGRTSGRGMPETFRSLTDEAFKKNEKKLFVENDLEKIYMNLPKINYKDFVVDFKDVYSSYKNEVKKILRDTHYYKPNLTEKDYYDIEGFTELKNSIKNSVAYLVKEFELKKNATQMKKASVSKTGDLNMNKIYSYNFNEDIFKKMTVVPNGKSHGLVIIVDWSGSMQGHLMNTVKQLFHIVMFCKKINVPYEVYSFTDSYSYDATKPRQVYRKGDVRIDGNFLLQNILSHRMNPAQFIEAASAITLVAKGKNNLEIPKTFYMGGTPLNSVIVTAMDMVTDFKHKNRLEIVNTVFLTDGDSQRFENYVDPSYTIVSIPYMSYIKGEYRSYSIVMTDPVTKYQVEYDTSSAKKETSALMELMRMRTNCNVIGFYILSLYEIGGQLQYFSKSKEESDKHRENFIKDNHCVLTNAGYNEYYLIRSEKYVDSNDTFSTSASTTRGLVNAFTKFAGKKVNNRVVLNRFINLITGQMEQHI